MKVFTFAFLVRLGYGSSLSKNDSLESQEKAKLASLLFSLHPPHTRTWQPETLHRSPRTLPVVDSDGRAPGESTATSSSPATSQLTSAEHDSTSGGDGVVNLASEASDSDLPELLPLATDDGNIDPEFVERIDREVFELTGVALDDLLNPAKVVNLERDLIITKQDLEECTDAEEKSELEKKLKKIEADLFIEKRAVFRQGLKNVFVGQSVLAVLASGYYAFDENTDLVYRCFSFWSWWLFTIPSLRARRPKGWEKKALDIAFLTSPFVTIGIPFFILDPFVVWAANFALVVVAYAYGYISGDDGDMGAFSGALKALDFGSGQERGMRADKREALEQKLREQELQQEQ